MQNISEYLKGFMIVEISGDRTERFLNMCSYQNITLLNLIPQKDSYRFQMSLHDKEKLRPILRKTKVKFRIIKKTGLPFRILQYKNRCCFLIGMLLCITLIHLLSLHLWEIDIEGNHKESTETIASFLSELNIKRGVSMDSIHCLSLSEKIREQFSDIVWVSASTCGTRLLIQIKENETVHLPNESSPEASVPTDLIAKKDGVICQIVTRSGTPKVAMNDEVKKGQLLVSGCVEIQNDSQEIIGYEYTTSDADIIAKTSMTYSDHISLYYSQKIYEKTIYYPYLMINQTIIGMLPKSKNEQSVEIFDKNVALLNDFQIFPDINSGVKTAYRYKIIRKKHTKKELQSILNTHFLTFCSDLNKKGVQITANSVKILIDTASASASGQIEMIESITHPQVAEIKTIERKTE